MRKSLKIDFVLAGVIAALLLFGLVMITSIGVPKSISLSNPDTLYPSCSDENVDCYLLFKKHLVRLFFGAIAFFVFLKTPIRFWKKVAPVFFTTTVLMLLAVLILGQSHDTIATSWLVIFNTSIQPSEFAKLALIIYLAYWFSKKGNEVENFHDGFIPYCIISSIMIIPVILQNDYGSTIVMAMISVAMFFAAGANLKHLALGFLVSVFAAGIVVATVPHVQERFKGFTSIDAECIEDYCWQSRQANIAIGTGGFWGRGLSQGVQKSYWLPQASDDFIFAASAEELGFIRISLVVLAYFILAYRGFKIADNAAGNFEVLVSTGVTTWLVGQAFINIAVNTALLPVTGITLPFISYGGSSLVACLIAAAILLNISSNQDYHANRSHRRRHRGTRHTQYRAYKKALR